MHQLKYLIIAVCLTTIWGCATNKASVTCTNVEKFQSRSGVFNAPMFSEGTVVILDPTTKAGGFAFKCNIPSDGISVTPQTDTLEILTRTFFNIDLSGKVSRSEASVQGQIKTAINNKTSFLLKNSTRTTVNNPSLAINAPEIFNQLKPILNGHPNYICLFVSGLIKAQEFSFKVDKDANHALEANIIKVGNFNIKVEYGCEGLVRSIGQKSPGIFFKSTFFKMNQVQTALILTPADIDLSEYNLINASHN